MNNPGARVGVVMLLLGWMVFAFAIVPFVYGIGPPREIGLAVALTGAVVMALGGFWAWKAGVFRARDS